ncbi:DUF2309 domain-containing protein [Halocalculus aciditolerans]|uniref:Probable inorganic carbon transporter subunit DabA n=1 Tax=Halocalculus aciditolerans TaxID=1383812 RepID=A0A830F9Y0_9EURY|nr:DUF2309 domain-containing protein [Halocalculus aciditolerans]GGL54149.1 UPF0753 protein [Halocalculus aciditolerans]
MTTDTAVEESIDAAADAVGSAWPIHSFVTANPLAGFEDRPFHEAVAAGERRLDGDGYPSADTFRNAWEAGEIDGDELRDRLTDAGYAPDPEAALDRLADAESEATTTNTTDAATTDADAETATDRVDAVVSKWLAAFLDEGRAEWPMPNRSQGFYAAFRTVAPHDGDIPGRDALADLPDDPLDAIRDALADVPVGEWRDVFEYHLTALPGWTGFVKHRAEADGDWQEAHPITLGGYLAVRLALVDRFDAPLTPEDADAPAADDPDESGESGVPLAHAWLAAWEATYRDSLTDAVAAESAALADTGAGEDGSDGERPDAQLVFCIDTRSEILRRHVEEAGDYETYGYAGFFGVPMRFEGYDAALATDACPPIVDAEHYVADRPRPEDAETHETAESRRSLLEAGAETIEDLRKNAATAFSFVENTGVAYGAALAARTLLPNRVYDALERVDDRVPDAHEFCEPTVDYNPDGVHGLREGLTRDEQVEYAANAFELMGLTDLSRLVVFTGHASDTTNNPFDSSLDCGACAGNPGGPNARVLAAICNDDAVQRELRERGIDIPEDTVFLAAEHDTTTDAVELYDGDVPETHADDVESLRADLATAQADAAAERARDMGVDIDESDAGTGVREVERRAADWAETRPEWGLAGNAGLVVGPRALTDDLDLDGRVFLHSYDWTTDESGEALAAIFAGPLVVTQWINTQYYFAAVDNAAYGSGSKITQNPVGNVGVYQGNGGDLRTGLPRESLFAADGTPYHRPLRLSAVVHAPREQVRDAVAANETVAALLGNEWLSLTVVDPTRDHRAFRYETEGWTPLDEEKTAEPTAKGAPTPSVADD